MNVLNKFLARISFKMFFFWIIPVVNASLALIQYLSFTEAFELMDFIRELLVTFINPYFIGLIWLVLYSIWNGSTKIKKSGDSFSIGSRNAFGFENLNLENYMKSVVYAWMLQLSLLISGVI